MPTYETTFYVLFDEAGRTFERSNTILHTADGDAQAVEDAARFYRNRVGAEESLDPEHRYWTRLGCMKVGQISINPIAVDGNYATMRSPVIYEWKCDFPWPLGEGNW